MPYYVTCNGSHIGHVDWFPDDEENMWCVAFDAVDGALGTPFETFKEADEYARFLCFERTHGRADDYLSHGYKIVVQG